MNQGVGGVFSIFYFDDKGTIVELSEDESRLATEIVRVSDVHLIKREAVRESLDALLYKKTNFETVENEVFKKEDPNYDKTMRFLRGYKN